MTAEQALEISKQGYATARGASREQPTALPHWDDLPKAMQVTFVSVCHAAFLIGVEFGKKQST